MTTAPRKPELSIIIVSYNTLEMTRECLASIFNNASDLSLEVIVVDNNSQDGSVNMIRNEFSQVKIISNKENRGFAAANNQGFTLCRSDYILLLNSDTIILGQALQASLAYLKNHPEAGAMGCRILNTDLSVQASCSGYPTLPRLLLMTSGFDRISALSFLDHYLMRHWPRDKERKVEVISGCFLLFRREILNQVGGFDENFFFFAEETDWCRRIREAGWSLHFAPVGDIVHHGGGSVKKLNHRRDVMLTAATVRLHRKHGCLSSALAAYLVLMTFNVSRALFWTAGQFLAPAYQDRARHFRMVVRSYRECWPV